MRFEFQVNSEQDTFENSLASGIAPMDPGKGKVTAISFRQSNLLPENRCPSILFASRLVQQAPVLHNAL